MKTKLVIADQEFLLDDTDQNQEIVRKIQEGTYPGLVHLDTAPGPISANLSEAVPFVLVAMSGKRNARRKAVIL